MKNKIKKDIISVLDSSYKAIKDDQFHKLKPISERVIHNISIYQDRDSVTISTLIYSLYKIMPKSPGLKPFILKSLRDLKRSLIKNNFSRYNKINNSLFDEIKDRNFSIKEYVKTVFEQASLKKGAHAVYHGLSIAKVAKTFGISRWELQNYLGKANLIDDYIKEYDYEKRLELLYKTFKEDNDHCTLILDAGPVINFALNNLLWVYEKFKKDFDVRFLIPKNVFDEVIKKPLKTRKYKFEALEVSRLISKGVFDIVEEKPLENTVNDIEKLANNSFKARGRSINLIHGGELEVYAYGLQLLSDIMVIDEATARYLIESPERVRKRFERKLHTSVNIDENNLKKLTNKLSHLNVVRSVDLAVFAYDLGYFSELESEKIKGIIGRDNLKAEILDSLLWALKLSGCAISEQEIYNIIELERKKFKNK